MKLLLLLCALALSCSAMAGERFQANPSEAGRHAQTRVSMGEAMEIVSRNIGGRVLLAQPATINGHEGYRIKVITQSGVVRVVHVDAETGAME